MSQMSSDEPPLPDERSSFGDPCGETPYLEASSLLDSQNSSEALAAQSSLNM